MTIINPNSISGITSFTAEADVMNFYRSNGTLGSLQLNGCNFHSPSGISTFNNLYVGGVLTYEDVRNVDSIGIITARAGVNVTANTDTDTLNVSGISTFSNTLYISSGGLSINAGDLLVPDYIKHHGDNDTYIRFVGNDVIAAGTAGGERLRIASDGNIGINKSSGMSAKLHIGDSGNNNSQSQLIKLGNDSSGAGTGAQINMGAAHANESTAACISGFLDSLNGTAFTVKTAGTYANQSTVAERFRITSAGKVGIGISTPDALLTLKASNPTIRFYDGSSLTGAIEGDTAQNTIYGYNTSDVVISTATGSSYTERLRFGATGITTTQTGFNFPDGKMAIFGNSSDLQIWHDGNNSRISDRGGTGNLQIETNNAILMQVNDGTNAMAKFFPTGNYQNEFYNDNAWTQPKLRTTDKGIDIFHDGDYGLSFSDDIGEIGDVAGFQAVNKAMSANTPFGIRATDIRFATGSTEKVRIDSTGRLGLKTTAMSSYNGSGDDVVIDNGAADVGVTLDSETQCSFAFTDSAKTGWDGWIKYVHSDNHLEFGAGAGERLRIASDGDVRINASSSSMQPGATLSILSDKNVETGVDDMDNYHLVLKNPNNDTGEAIGLAFGITDTTAKVGAAILHERDAAGSQGSLKFLTRPDNSGPPVERLKIQSGGEVRVAQFLTVARDSNNASNFTKGGLVFSTPAYSEYHYTWSGQSSYTIDLTCASYFHAEFTYVQHQTNGGSEMQYYARGKWANNHTQHTGIMWEWAGDGGGLDVQFNVSDQSGNGNVNMRSGLGDAGNTTSSHGFVNGGGEGTGGSANGRLRISESYSWGSVSGRALIVKVYYGSFSISKS